MNEQTAWYLARASGIVALALLVASLVWGVLLTTRVLRPHDRPAWLLDLHRWLAGSAVVMTGLHLVGLWLDSYLVFGPAELLVPGASPYRPMAVAIGIAALYLLVVVEATSLVRRHLPRRVWSGLHLGSYLAAWCGIAHGALAGTDAGSTPYRSVALGLTVVAVAAALVRVLRPGRRATTRQDPAASPVNQDAALEPSSSVA